MKPSADFQSLLDDGAANGASFHERLLLLRHLAAERSSDLLDSFKREVSFVPPETVLPALNVAALKRSVLRDNPGAAPAFNQELLSQHNQTPMK